MAESSRMDGMMEMKMRWMLRMGHGSCVIRNGASCDNICSESTCIAANYAPRAKVQLICFSISKIRTQI